MGRFSNCNFYNRCDILFCLKNREIQLKNISFSQKKKNSFKKKKKSAIEKSYRAIPKLIFIKSKKRVKKGRMQQSISILIVRAISNRIRVCVCTHDVMKSVENGWVCSGQQFSRHCLHGRKFNSEVALFITTWEAEGRRGGVHAPRATTCIRSFHKGCWNVFVQLCLAPQTRHGCVLTHVWSVYAHTLHRKTSFRGLAAHAYLQFAYENFVIWYAQRFSNFFFIFIDRIDWYFLCFGITSNNCSEF